MGIIIAALVVQIDWFTMDGKPLKRAPSRNEGRATLAAAQKRASKEGRLVLLAVGDWD